MIFLQEVSIDLVPMDHRGLGDTFVYRLSKEFISLLRFLGGGGLALCLCLSC